MKNGFIEDALYQLKCVLKYDYGCRSDTRMRRNKMDKVVEESNILKLGY